MRASQLIAPLLLTLINGQAQQQQYPANVPTALKVASPDGAPIDLTAHLAKGKTLLVFATDACPMMPQGGNMSPLTDYAAIRRTILDEKREGARVFIVMDCNAEDYQKRNPVIKDMPIYNASSRVWDAFGARRANESYFIEDGKIMKKNPGSNRDMLAETVQFLGLKTETRKIFANFSADARKKVISGCSPLWPETGSSQARMLQPLH